MSSSPPPDTPVTPVTPGPMSPELVSLDSGSSPLIPLRTRPLETMLKRRRSTSHSCPPRKHPVPILPKGDLSRSQRPKSPPFGILPLFDPSMYPSTQAPTAKTLSSLLALEEESKRIQEQAILFSKLRALHRPSNNWLMSSLPPLPLPAHLMSQNSSDQSPPPPRKRRGSSSAPSPAPGVRSPLLSSGGSPVLHDDSLVDLTAVDPRSLSAVDDETTDIEAMTRKAPVVIEGAPTPPPAPQGSAEGQQSFSENHGSPRRKLGDENENLDFFVLHNNPIFLALKAYQLELLSKVIQQLIVIN